MATLANPLGGLPLDSPFSGGLSTPAPGTTDATGSTSGLWSNLSNIIGSIGSAVGNTYQAFNRPAGVTLQTGYSQQTPYPYLQNGAVVGYGSVPQNVNPAAVQTGIFSSGNMGTLLLLGGGALLVFFLLRK